MVRHGGSVASRGSTPTAATEGSVEASGTGEMPPKRNEEDDALLRVMAKNLSTLIAERRTSAHKVSVAAGLNKNYVGRIVTEDDAAAVPSISTAMRIARVLGVTLDELIEAEPIARAPRELGDLSEILLAMDEESRLRVIEAIRLLATQPRR